MEITGSEPGAAVVNLSRTEVLFPTNFCGQTARGLYEVMDRRIGEQLQSELLGALAAIDETGE